jgi:CubicO group peptidase (beta-lactamase class C family)
LGSALAREGVAKPAYVAATVFFLCAEETEYLTGAIQRAAVFCLREKLMDTRSDILLLGALSLAAICSALACESPTQPGYRYEIPDQTDDGWQTASLDEVGISEEILGGLIEAIDSDVYENVHSVLIVKDGWLVFEEYFAGYSYDWWDPQFRGRNVEFDIDATQNVHSVTKSITSSLLGITVDHGFIQSVDEPVFAFFPEYSHLRDESKDRITLAHLLTMTSGLDWNENDVPPGDMSNDVVQLFVVSDPIAYILAKAVVAEPGTRWQYNSGGVNLLGEVIRRATGARVDEFAGQQLFARLGIADYEWNYINADVVFTSGDLGIRPRDMAKLGYLYLNGGLWNGERIVSQGWIEASTNESVSFDRDDWTGYGYLWWLRTYHVNSAAYHTFQALGWGGQRSIVFRDLDMVVVFTGGNYVTPERVDEIIVQYILPAVAQQNPN